MMLDLSTEKRREYVLGHSTPELQRLIDQARFFGDLTAQVLTLAGLQPGMRVLDVGCGTGDVSFLAAQFVGPSGAVIGIDTSADAVNVAEQRVHTAGLTNVSFHVADVMEWTTNEPVDAVIGRLVLMYFADPAVALRRLAASVAPGGIIAFHEIDINGATSEPACPFFETTVNQVRQAFTRAGADIRMGMKLSTTFQEAGLPAPRMILGARAEHGPDSGIYDQLALITRTLLPLMEKTGIVSPGEIDITSLADRLRDEAVSRDATLISPSLIGAWARKPASI